MADRYLLESGSPDGYLLEDGTGVLLLEDNRDWVPTDLGAPCVGSFDLSSASKVTLNSGNISAVTNDAGGSVTLTQGTGANQPPFTAGSGASFVLAGSTSLSIANLSTATEYHYFIVGTPNANTSFRTALWAATNEHPLLIQTGTDNVGHYISGFQQFTSVTALAAAEAQFYAHITPSAVSSGATNGNTPASTPSAYGATNTNAAVLGNSSGGSQGFGWIRALVIVSGTLTSGDRQKVEGYLAWKYSSVGNLPSGHPYASAQPTIATTVTHATTGVLTGPGSTIAGTAVYNAAHPTSGALTGPGSTIAGTAAHIAIHTSTGALTGPGSTIVGSAARTREHATTGALTGPGSTIAGVAVYNAKHTTFGALTGPGSVVIGAAARTRAHATTGVLTGPGSTVAGAAVYNAKHTTSGTLTGPGSTLAGSATRFRAFATSGVLVGPGSTIAGVAARSGIVVTVHATSGVLIGQPSIIDGTAARTRQHATSGVLTGPPAFIFGYATRWRDHDSSGALLGVTGVVFGRAFNGTPQLHDIPVDSDNLTDETPSPGANLGSISEPSGQIVNHPPYPPA